MHQIVFCLRYIDGATTLPASESANKSEEYTSDTEERVYANPIYESAHKSEEYTSDMEERVYANLS